MILFICLYTSCKKEQHIGFGLENANVYEDKSRKTKKKNDAEYISILYTNLYQSPISPNQLYKTQNVLYSIGDQDVASEMLLSNYFNTGSIQMPTNTLMRQDIESFVTNTYKRFYLRYPSEGEKAFFKQYITKNSTVSVEMVYTAFATSKEYQYY
jgi:hypothetical protein